MGAVLDTPASRVLLEGRGGVLFSVGELSAGPLLVPSPQSQPGRQMSLSETGLKLAGLHGSLISFSEGSKVVIRHYEDPVPQALDPNLHSAFASEWPSLSSPYVRLKSHLSS